MCIHVISISQDFSLKVIVRTAKPPNFPAIQVYQSISWNQSRAHLGRSCDSFDQVATKPICCLAASLARSPAIRCPEKNYRSMNEWTLIALCRLRAIPDYLIRRFLFCHTHSWNAWFSLDPGHVKGRVTCKTILLAVLEPWAECCSREFF